MAYAFKVDERLAAYPVTVVEGEEDTLYMPEEHIEGLEPAYDTGIAVVNKTPSVFGKGVETASARIGEMVLEVAKSGDVYEHIRRGKGSIPRTTVASFRKRAPIQAESVDWEELLDNPSEDGYFL